MILNGELRWSDFQMLRKYDTIICDLDGTLYDDKVFVKAIEEHKTQTYHAYLNVCRTIEVKLELYPEAKKLIEEFNIVVLTNGDQLRQKHKVKLLGLTCPVYYADYYERKPSSKGVQAILKDYPGKAILIGDHTFDMQCAKNAKIDFIWWQRLSQ